MVLVQDNVAHDLLTKSCHNINVINRSLINMLSKTLSTVFSFLLLFSFLLIIPAQASAQTFEWSGVCVGEGPNTDVATIQGAECLIANVFIVTITLIGLVGFVMFIFGAIKWMMSGSDTQGVKKAGSTMLYSVVGLVVALSAFIIINLIADFTGVNVIRSFKIPTSQRGFASPNCMNASSGATCRSRTQCTTLGNRIIGQYDCTSPEICCAP